MPSRTHAMKPGVRLAGLQPQMVLAYVIACEVYESHGCPCWITALDDGQHMPGSLHYQGRAMDLRIPSFWGAPTSTDRQVADELREALSGEYDVVLESPDTPGATGGHIHVEWDPPTVNEREHA